MEKKYIVLSFCLLPFLSCSDKADKLLPPVLTPVPVNPSEYSVTVVTDNIPADGATYAEAVVKAGPSVLAKYNEATVDVTPIGKLSTGTTSSKIKLDVNGEAHVFVSSSAIGKANVNIAVGNLSKSASVTFVVAGPDNMLVETDVASIRPIFDTKVVVKARLTRQTGTVSLNQVVQFYDSATGGRSVGVFLNGTSSNAQGECTTEYRLTDTSYHGPVYLLGNIQANNKNVNGKTRILIQ